MSLIIYGDSLI